MRLDQYLCEKGFYSSRTKASQAIEKMQITVNGAFKKNSYDVKESDEVIVLEAQKYVSMGGYKLEKAMLDFDFSAIDKTFIDVGASTGGFTDCLLQFGAKKVFALDVGVSLLDKKLTNDKRVISIENVNARDINSKTLTEKVDGAVIDCSFISLKYIIQPLKSVLKDDAEIIALIKPQFECGKNNLGKSGVVKSIEVQKNVCKDIFAYCNEQGYNVVNFTSSTKRLKKNIEFLILLSKTGINVDEKKFEMVFSDLKEKL